MPRSEGPGAKQVSQSLLEWYESQKRQGTEPAALSGSLASLAAFISVESCITRDAFLENVGNFWDEFSRMRQRRQEAVN